MSDKSRAAIIVVALIVGFSMWAAGLFMTVDLLRPASSCVVVSGFVPDGVVVYEDQVPRTLTAHTRKGTSTVRLRAYEEGYIYYTSDNCEGGVGY